ncbi:AAA family ATPase [Plebeiibacterium marinum]|uniref:ATP-binding protein n=1 Tax=Plebeiibacterium marinum TaxID=2992111 RepID=A0AAE3MB75_9BACT|nr:AAA family ATPase [Plebeiobacterium marinum]MCW3804409.1 ATP-binding protein [Plebeiobacterium marinum]
MSRIRIKNFGPIKSGYNQQEGWLDINKVTVFIGNQGSGKSTVAKLISTFSWIEKVLVRGDYNKSRFENDNALKDQYISYHRLENYFTDETCLEYEGDAYCIVYDKGDVKIYENSNAKTYTLPQIMYVPAERNFISYVKTPKELKLSSKSLSEFLTEFDNARKSIKDDIDLPVNNTKLDYDQLNDSLNVLGSNYSVGLTEASSGFQSLVPLFLVSDYLSKNVSRQSKDNASHMSVDEKERFKTKVQEILQNDSLTEEQQRLAISVLSSKFNKSSLINIVEEPEQNLFPSSQWNILQSLLGFNNINVGNKLILTTHSPYMVNFLSIAIQAETLKNEVLKNDNKDELLKKLDAVIEANAIVSGDEVAIYQLNELDGSIGKLQSFEGIPSSNNYLNNSLIQGNSMFDSLLEIEEEL